MSIRILGSAVSEVQPIRIVSKSKRKGTRNFKYQGLTITGVQSRPKNPPGWSDRQNTPHRQKCVALPLYNTPNGLVPKERGHWVPFWLRPATSLP